jgi:hypothetical protein
LLLGLIILNISFNIIVQSSQESSEMENNTTAIHEPSNNTATNVRTETLIDEIMHAIGVNDHSSMSGTSNQPPSIRDILESRSEHNYVEGENILIDFLMTLSREMSIQDLITMMSNDERSAVLTTHEILSRFRTPMQRFMMDKVIKSSIDMAHPTCDKLPTKTEVQNSMVRFLDSLFEPYLVSIGETVTTVEDIDFPETIYSFLSEGLTEILCDCLWNPQVPSQKFGEKLFQAVEKFILNLINLCFVCLSDGQSGVHSIISNILSTVRDNVGSTIEQSRITNLVDYLGRHVARAIENKTNESFDKKEFFKLYVVLKKDATERKLARKNRITQTNASLASSDATSGVSQVVRPSPIITTSGLSETTTDNLSYSNNNNVKAKEDSKPVEGEESRDETSQNNVEKPSKRMRLSESHK